MEITEAMIAAGVKAIQNVGLDAGTERPIVEAVLRAALTGIEQRYHTISEADVGRSAILAFGRQWQVSDFLGRVLPGDVGKRVYRVRTDDGSRQRLQVENDEQRSRRQSAEHGR